MILNILIYILITFYSFSLSADEDRLIIASTTSTNDTGLLKYLNNEFNKIYDVKIHVLSLGTGQALKVAKDGNADLLLVHHTPSEIEFIKKDYGIKRYDLMYNYFVLVGPKDDHNECNSIKDVLNYIFNNKKKFISRGDESGTHLKEISLWNLINKNPNDFNQWYKKIGQGMGATLMFANETKSYAISDMATWISFKNKKNLKIICKKQKILLNQYGIIAVNPEINSKINFKWAKIYIDWITSMKGENLINNYKINNKQLFYFNKN